MIASNLSTNEISQYKDLVVLLPFGSFEQHGPYLPLITDSAIAEGICKRIEEKMSDKVLLYPTLWIGDSMEHKEMDGTLSLSAMTAIKMLEEVFTWLQYSKFKRAILFNAHGGNVNLGGVICEEFSRANDLKVKNYFAFNKNIDEKAVEIFGYCEPHAGSVETSILYALRPDLIKTQEKIIKDIKPYQGGFSFFSSREISDKGIMNPKNEIEIDIEKGKVLIEFMVMDGIKNVEKMMRL